MCITPIAEELIVNPTSWLRDEFSILGLSWRVFRRPDRADRGYSRLPRLKPGFSLGYVFLALRAVSEGPGLRAWLGVTLGWLEKARFAAYIQGRYPCPDHTPAPAICYWLSAICYRLSAIGYPLRGVRMLLGMQEPKLIWLHVEKAPEHAPEIVRIFVAARQRNFFYR